MYTNGPELIGGTLQQLKGWKIELQPHIEGKRRSENKEKDEEPRPIRTDTVLSLASLLLLHLLLSQGQHQTHYSDDDVIKCIPAYPTNSTYCTWTVHDSMVTALKTCSLISLVQPIRHWLNLSIVLTKWRERDAVSGNLLLFCSWTTLSADTNWVWKTHKSRQSLSLSKRHIDWSQTCSFDFFVPLLALTSNYFVLSVLQ